MELFKQDNIRHTDFLEKRSVDYIVIHYTASGTSKPGKALETADYFRTTDRNASSDFIVDDRFIVQYNGDTENRYSWHCGESRNTMSKGGSLYGICMNRNSIGIEVCSSTTDGKMHEANSPEYFFTEAVLQNTIELTLYLMQKYDIPVDNVVRHYDVSGKFCPGIVGWNADSGDESKWNGFKKMLSLPSVQTAANAFTAPADKLKGNPFL